MSVAGVYRIDPAQLQTQRHARQLLARIRTQIAQARLVRWPAYEASFARDEQTLLALMRERGWTEKGSDR